LKKGYLGLITLALVVLISGCGGGGDKDKGNNGNPPPAEVTSVLDEFANNISNPEKAATAFSGTGNGTDTFTYIDFNGERNEISNAKEFLEDLDFSKFTIKNQSGWTPDSDEGITGALTLTAEVIQDSKSATYVFVLNMKKTSEGWKITSVLPKSISGNVFPDEMFFEENGSVTVGNGNGNGDGNGDDDDDYFNTLLTYVDYPIIEYFDDGSSIKLQKEDLTKIFADWSNLDMLDTPAPTCQLTNAEKGTISFAIEGYQKLDNQYFKKLITLGLIFVEGQKQWKFKTIKIT
jgi:hypothetical protein